MSKEVSLNVFHLKSFKNRLYVRKRKKNLTCSRKLYISTIPNCYSTPFCLYMLLDYKDFFELCNSTLRLYEASKNNIYIYIHI